MAPLPDEVLPARPPPFEVVAEQIAPEGFALTAEQLRLHEASELEKKEWDA